MEEKGGYSIAPVFKQLLLILLDVHQLVDNVHLDVKLLAISRVLTWRMEMILDTPRCKIMLQIALFVEQIDGFGRHEVFAVVQWHLVRSPSPYIF